MPTPVGPVPRDPNDPDLWEEWYANDEEDGGTGPSRFSWQIRLIALIALVGTAALFIFAR